VAQSFGTVRYNTGKAERSSRGEKDGTSTDNHRNWNIHDSVFFARGD
jgi:hypothetical protein